MKQLRIYQMGVLAVLLCVAVGLSGCPKATTGKITGWVSDTEGTQLPFVKVVLSDGKITYTDGSGLYAVEDASANKSLTATFTLDGYAPTSMPVEVETDGLASLNAVLALREEAKSLTIGGTAVGDGGGNSVQVPAEALAGSTKALTGNINIQITGLDLSDPNVLDAFPGTFLAQDGSGNRFYLEAIALAEFYGEINGQPVNVQAGATVTIQIKLPEDADFEEGDDVPLWYFDVQLGIWVQSGTGEVTYQAGLGFVVSADVTRFSWWCVANGWDWTQVQCIQGVANDYDDNPLEGGRIIAKGVDYQGVSFARTNELGEYTVYAKPGGTVRIILIPPGALYKAAEETIGPLPSEVATECVQPPNLNVVFDSCVSGYVTQRDGETPLADAMVYSSHGGTAVTDATGYFCMAVPGGVTLAVYVPGRPPKLVHTPDAADCTGEDCAEVLLNVVYPQNGDVVGMVFSRMYTPPLSLTARLTSTAGFYAGVDGEQYDLFMGNLAQDTYEVIVPDLAEDLTIDTPLATKGLFDPVPAWIFGLGFAMNDIFQADDDGSIAPAGGRFGPLDPGSPATLTNGTTDDALYSVLDFFHHRHGMNGLGQLGYGALSSWMASAFVQVPFIATGYDYGETLTYAWPGGIDLGAFSISAVMPEKVTFTAPADLKNIFPDTGGDFEDLVLTWDTTNSGDVLFLVLHTLVIDTNNEQVLGYGAIMCRVVDDGSFTIPSEALAQLPQFATTKALDLQVRANYLFALRTTVETAQSSLLRSSGKGQVLIFAGPEPTHMASWNGTITIE